jgi:LAO/AO transport system kinase
VVVLVPESGDEIQTMKAGLMEIADIFVVNKSDRPDSDIFLKNLRLMLAPAFQQHSLEIPIIKTIATGGTGINHLYEAINNHYSIATENSKKSWLLTEKAFQLIQKGKMKNINKEELKEKIMKASHDSSFNLYKFVKKYSS